MDGVSGNVKSQTGNRIGTLRDPMPSAEMVIVPVYLPGVASLGVSTSIHSGWLESGAISNGGRREACTHRRLTCARIEEGDEERQDTSRARPWTWGLTFQPGCNAHGRG